MMRLVGSRLFLALALAQLALIAGCKSPAPPHVKQERAPSGKNLVKLSAEAVSRNGIRLAKVTTRPLDDTIQAPAEVTLNPDRVAHVAPLVAGQLRSVSASIGDHVKAGQKLAVLRSVNLGEVRAERRRAKAMMQAAQANFARQKRLRTEGISSERAFLEAKLRHAKAKAERDAARAKLMVFGLNGGSGPDMHIIAPIAGTIIERHATRGENVEPADELFVIADTAKVWVVAHVYEQDMFRVHQGATARLFLQAQPKKSWEGKISFVAPVVDEKTRTLAVRVELDNKDGSLRPGLFGHLRIAVGKAEPVVAIPRDAVQTLHGAKVVFVPAGAPNQFRAQKVTVGRHSGGLVEIRQGLAAGDQIVVEGAFLLKSQIMAGESGKVE